MHGQPSPLALQPFGLCFRRRPVQAGKRVQSTWEPEITTGDGSDPDKLDSDWLPDEDEQDEEEE